MNIMSNRIILCSILLTLTATTRATATPDPSIVQAVQNRPEMAGVTLLPREERRINISTDFSRWNSVMRTKNISSLPHRRHQHRIKPDW